jgi:ribose 5-phosphate isomerase B
MKKRLIHAEAIRQAAQMNRPLVLQKGLAILTDEAKDLAHRLKLRIEWSEPPLQSDPGASELDSLARGRRSGVPREKVQVVLGADHGGYEMKEALKFRLNAEGFIVHDLGTHGVDPVDYPDFAREVAAWVQAGKASRGVMIDSIGVASAMVCNKVSGIRAAACECVDVALSSRRHNNANVLTLGGKRLSHEAAQDLCLRWLHEPYEGGRHQVRVDKMMATETKV